MFSKILMYYSIIYLIHSVIKKKFKKYRKEKIKNDKEIFSFEKNNNSSMDLSQSSKENNKYKDPKLFNEINNKKCIYTENNQNEINVNNYFSKFTDINRNANEGFSLFSGEHLCSNENTEMNRNFDLDIDIDIDSSLFSGEQYSNENIENNHNEMEVNRYFPKFTNENILKNKNSLILSKKIYKETSIFKKCISNYIVPENDNCNNLVFNFETKNNNYYKIICKMILNNIENINLKISNNNKEFIYNIEESSKINEFSFVLDNNQFNNDNISINLYFYNDNKQIEINDLYIEIIEKPILKAIDPIIIFNINNNYKPIYINICNILDFIDYNNENEYNNNMNDSPFFI